MVSLALVDDHHLFRDALRLLLEQEADLRVVVEAGDAAEAYSAIEEKRPDVILMDVGLPGVSGIAATRELMRRDPAHKVLILTMHTGEDFVSQGLLAGARGYALKTQPAPQLVEAIREVARGESYLSSRVSRYIVDDHLRLRRGETSLAGPCDALSPREREVFDLLVRGYSNDGVAAQLCISPKTVETHRAHILKKLRVHSLVELIRFAARHHLIAD